MTNYSLILAREISALTYNFTSETTKLPWQRSVRLRAVKDALESLNTEEHIKKDPIRYFVEKVLHSVLILQIIPTRPLLA